MTGPCEIEYMDGSKYSGDLVDGVYHGQGKLIWPCQSSYEGQFHAGEMHGQGRYQSAVTGEEEEE
jgi:hypothetical protein